MLTARPNWALPPWEQLTINVVFGVVMLTAFIYMASIARKEKSWYPIFMFLGGGLTVFYEPLNNVLGLATYAEIDQLTLIDTLGRKIPLYIGFAYFFYWTASSLWIMRAIDRGLASMRQWWRWYLIAVVMATTFELLPVHRGWWTYYGDQQPLKVLGFPAWWWFVNPGTNFAAGTLFHLLRKYIVDDRHSFLFLPLFPVVITAAHASVALPVFTALNTTTDVRTTTAAALLTIGLELMLMWLCGRVALRESRVAEDASAHTGAAESASALPSLSAS